MTKRKTPDGPTLGACECGVAWQCPHAAGGFDGVHTVLDKGQPHPEFMVLDPHQAYADQYWVPSWEWVQDPIRMAEMVYVDTTDTVVVCPNEDAAVPSGLKPAWKLWVGPSDSALEEWVVDFNEYRRPTCSTDKFDAPGPEKHVRNRQFVEFLRKFRRSQREVVVLDAPGSCLSTNTLDAHRAELDLKAIHVPNLDRNFLRRAGAKFRTKATYYFASVYEWMRDLYEDRLPHTEYDFGLDYCCTFWSNGVTKPRADLTLLFARKLLARHNGVLWLTVSSRTYRVRETLRNVARWVVDAATTYGYAKLQVVAKGSYAKNMCYFYFRTVDATRTHRAHPLKDKQ